MSKTETISKQIPESTKMLADERVLPSVFYSGWKNEYSKVWEDSEDIKYHISIDEETVLCGMHKRDGRLWHFGEELAKTKANEYYLCKNCLKIAKAKHGW